MNRTLAKFVIIIIILAGTTIKGLSQSSIPEILNNGTLKNQMDYLNEKTRVYDNYRAVREDMFQLMMKNAVDSLNKSHSQVMALKTTNNALNVRIDSLKSNLAGTTEQLDEAIRTKDRIEVIGIKLDKRFYNSAVWLIIAVLLFLLGAGFVVFKRNLVVTLSTRKELTDLKAEFEDYRQKKRIEKEKLEMDHFNEVKKLKGL